MKQSEHSPTLVQRMALLCRKQNENAVNSSAAQRLISRDRKSNFALGKLTEREAAQTI